MWAELSYRQQVLRIRRGVTGFLAQHGMAGRLVFIHHGENTTFRLQNAQGEFLVRVHRPGYQSDAAIRSEVAWLAAMREADLRVPEPIVVGGDGLNFVSVEHDPVPRRVVVFRWTPGRFITRMGPGHAAEYGRVLAQMHNFVETWQRPPAFERARLDLEGLAGSRPVMGGGFHLLEPRARAEFESWRNEIRARLVTLGQGPDVFNLIHADLHLRNIVFGDHGAVPIDFDDAGLGYFLYDLAVTMGSFRYAGVEALVAPAFVASYRAWRPLTDDHLALIPTFRALRAMCITLWVLGRSDHPHFRERGPLEVQRAMQSVPAYLDAP